MNTKQLFFNHVAPTSPMPLQLEVSHAEGLYITAVDGKKYVDLISGISVGNLGHRHPAVVAAIKNQVDKYLHTMVYGEHIQQPQVQLATLLASVLPEKLNCVYFTNSGSEATEGAMKLAKRFTGRHEIIAFKKSYHGSTQGALSMIGDEYFKQPFRPLLPGIRLIDFNNHEALDAITTNTAAVFVETVKAEAGVILIEKDFFIALRKRCDETGTLLILDEIQTGMGRTGKLFSFEHFNIVPDVLLLGKAFGGGLPLAAFISSQKIMHTLSENPVLGHITTFGGNPVCCAAGLANLEILLQEKELMEVCERETLLRNLLKHDAIKALRSFGLLMALEFENFETMKKVMDNCFANGVLVDWFLFADNCIRIAPPLTISESEIREVCKIIIDAIEAATSKK